jgi:hypothetical protein
MWAYPQVIKSVVASRREWQIEYRYAPLCGSLSGVCESGDWFAERRAIAVQADKGCGIPQAGRGRGDHRFDACIDRAGLMDKYQTVMLETNRYANFRFGGGVNASKRFVQRVHDGDRFTRIAAGRPTPATTAGA